MYPNAFLRAFWEMEIRLEVFVAMSFDERYRSRFDKVIEPAISSIRVGDVPLKARRVDTSKSGDSILTEIVDGIAHARLVLADLSTVGKDAVTGRSLPEWERDVRGRHRAGIPASGRCAAREG